MYYWWKKLQYQKGYVEKVQSPYDRREYHLRPTKKYMDYYNISSNYLKKVMDRVKTRFTPEETKQLDRMLRIVDQELMPEIPLKHDETPEEQEKGEKAGT